MVRRSTANPVHVSSPLGGRNFVSSDNVWTYEWILAVIIIAAKTEPRLKGKDRDGEGISSQERKKGGFEKQ
jgi:hypothetical protein